jgi:MraZ protein
MFLGRYITTFNGKNRIILPKKFRQELSSYEIILIPGLDGGIWGFGKEEFEDLGREILKLPLQESRGRLLRRQFFSKAEQTDLDKQGRFILPNMLVTNALIKQKILIIGAGDHFEIWNPEEYEKLMNVSS